MDAEFFPAEREIHVDDFDPMLIYCELAVRTVEEPDASGIAIETMFDRDGLHVKLLDQYGGSRSVRLVLAPDEPPAGSGSRRSIALGRESLCCVWELASPITDLR